MNQNKIKIISKQEEEQRSIKSKQEEYRRKNIKQR